MCSTMYSVIHSRNPVVVSRTIMTTTVSQLNMSCTVAAAKARRKASRSPICVMLTIVLVTLVPTLEPKIMGTA